MEFKRYPVGTVRSANLPMYVWCAHTYENEMIWQGHLLLIVSDDGYYRVFNIDDGRLYHISQLLRPEHVGGVAVIKQGYRKALKTQGTVLLVEKAYGGAVGGWWHKEPILVGGDLLMLTGKRDSLFKELEVISVANATKMWIERKWLLANTSLAFDARVLEDVQDA